MLKAEKKLRAKVEKLTQLLRGRADLLIVMQDNPDPDSIAAAVALRRFANSLADVACSITHGGTVGRAENRALVHYLGLNLRKCGDIEFDRFDLVALVDTQPGTGNNCFPLDKIPDIVFDHHPLRHATREADFFDVRSRYGATSTILLEYLLAAGVELDIPLATALMYGIRSDTQDFERQATAADMEAITTLYPVANKRMLGEIQRGSVERQYYRVLRSALNNTRVYGRVCLCSLGQVTNPDMIGEVADLLVRDEEVHWSLCYGFYGDKMLLSLRTSEPDNRADLAMRRIIGRKGTGGGHPSYAGGQIPLAGLAEKERTKTERLVRRKALRLLGVADQPGQRLVEP